MKGNFRRHLWNGAIAAICWGILVSGCTTIRNKRPDRTSLETDEIILPVLLVSNYIIVETNVPGFGTARFLLDTGSSISHISRALAAKVKIDPLPANAPPIYVRSASGDLVPLHAVSLRKLKLGSATFEGVRALVRDSDDLSAHLGLRIDGILGFPVFRETLLTIDYARRRVVISARKTEGIPGNAIAFNNDKNIPIIPIRLGNESLAALIDSGSDAALSLNPVGLRPRYVQAPRQAGLVATLSGDHPLLVARLADPLVVGTFSVTTPTVQMTDDLSSLGGALLKSFTITFDQKRNQVTLQRDGTGPIPTDNPRTTGLSFSKSDAYWRVVNLIPDSSASALGIQVGDLCTQINEEPVTNWDLTRFQQLVNQSTTINITFVHGSETHTVPVPIFELLPKAADNP